MEIASILSVTIITEILGRRYYKRRRDIEGVIHSLDEMIEEIEQEAVNRELVMLALNKFTDVFDHIQPHHQKELLRLILHKAVLAPDSIKVALYGRPPETGLLSICESEIRSQIATWLPHLPCPLYVGLCDEPLSIQS